MGQSWPCGLLFRSTSAGSRKKQDDGEKLREAQGSQIIELISKHSELSGRINGYIEAKKDLKELGGMPSKVEQIHSEVLKITDAVVDNE